ncbi:MAG TPA: hypothetical protein VJC21_03320 [Candidatus Nanoarchaeia archaeon]|nr:hypothetical protein [Candidatus Nanoarchaeia archaeon]
MAKRKGRVKSSRKSPHKAVRKSSPRRGGRHTSNKSKVSKVQKLIRLAKQRRLKKSVKKAGKKR